MSDKESESGSVYESLSGSFISNYDDEFYKPPTAKDETPASTKLRQRHLKSKKPTSEIQISSKNSASSWGYKTLVICISVTMTVIVAIFVTTSLMSSTRKSKLGLGIHTFKRELKTTVFGQDQAISAILSEIISLNDSGLKVLLLVGGPGVGKDLFAQTVTLEFFRQTGNKCKALSYLLLDHKEQICVRPDFNVISIETVRDEKDIVKAVRLVKKMLDQDVKGIVFLPVLAAKALKEHNSDAFETLTKNSEYVSLVSSKGESIKNELYKEGINCKLILFNPISREIVQKCLGLTRLHDQKLVDFVMGGREFALNGCKGLEYLIKTGF